MWNLILVTSLVTFHNCFFAEACKSEPTKLGKWYVVGDWMVRTQGDDEYRYYHHPSDQLLRQFVRRESFIYRNTFELASPQSDLNDHDYVLWVMYNPSHGTISLTPRFSRQRPPGVLARVRRISKARVLVHLFLSFVGISLAHFGLCCSGNI